ncbi:MAG TPA: ABC transporter ATP-binding protein [Candidatus Limnocylindrales bacterium]|nr:ABC transporter ATP-binding protein [Candidatus Limnocylindrales bacterium]
MAVLEALHLTRRFGRRDAVSDVTFAVRPGEVYGFLGPNGAGKTTTIRIILGLLRPSHGGVLVNGVDATRDHVGAARFMGAVLETPAFYPYLTGRETLRQAARIRGGVPETRIARLLRLVELADRADAPVRAYSLGMRQRLALAQALLAGPRLLVLDEPTNGLDPAGIHDMRELIGRLARDEGVAVFFSTHLLSEAEAICDRVAVVHHGRLMVEGSLADLTRRDRHELEVSVSDPGRAAILLAPLASVHEIGAPSSRVRIESARDLSQDVIRRLMVAGIAVNEVRRRRRRLEDVFLELTAS